MDSELIKKVLSRAIQEEVSAQELYSRAATETDDKTLKAMFEEMAGMEREHESKLRAILEGGVLSFDATRITDLKISDYLIERPLPQVETIQEIMIFAMKSEKRAHETYTALAQASVDAEEKELFSMLAREELQHKRGLEEKYDDNIYQWN